MKKEMRVSTKLAIGFSFIGVLLIISLYCEYSTAARIIKVENPEGYLNRYSINQIEIVSGAFMFIRKEALNKVGLLDETFFMYGEDIDLSYRVLKGGYQNYYLPLQILHYKGESTKKDSIRYINAFHKAMIIFFKKHFAHYSFLYSFLSISTKQSFQLT